MEYIIGFLPWLAFFILSAINPPTRHSLLLAAGVGLLASLILLIPAGRKHTITTLDVGGIVFFPFFALLSLYLPIEFLDNAAAALGPAGLTVALGIGLVIGRPFTLTYARAGVPEALRDNPGFVKGASRLTVGWFVAFLIMTLFSVVGAFFNPAAVESVVFNWAIPVVIMVITVRWQIGQINQMQSIGEQHRQERINRIVEPGQRPADFLDHISVKLPASQVKAVFERMHSWGLVSAWDPESSEGFTTAGIRLGNLNLELAAASKEIVPMDSWVTYEPVSLKGLVAELERRNIPADPFDTLRVGDMDIYTRVPLPTLATTEFAIQLCQTFTPVRTTSPVAPPNPPGIVNVDRVELSIDASHWDTMAKLMAPLDITEPMNLGQGPVVQLTRGDSFGITSLALLVTDPEQARHHFGQFMKTGSNGELFLGSLTIELKSGHSQVVGGQRRLG